MFGVQCSMFIASVAEFKSGLAGCLDFFVKNFHPFSVKHFIIEITYTATIGKIDAILSDHRAFLQSGYDQGLVLMSGPQNPRTGGIIVARAESLEAAKQFFSQDPFQTKKAARYRFIEFSPVKHTALVRDWV